jgi:predicted dithiol-disulfide oxidoreductase (DUF899 family)
MASMTGPAVLTYLRERLGRSTFVLEDGAVQHTYSSYSREVDGLWGMYQWLDRVLKERNQTGVWWRRYDDHSRIHKSILRTVRLQSQRPIGCWRPGSLI